MCVLQHSVLQCWSNLRQRAMSHTVGAAAALPRLQHAALPRIGCCLLPTLPQTPTVGATQRRAAVPCANGCELAHAKVWFALGLARVIGTASATGEFAADRTGLTGARAKTATNGTAEYSALCIAALLRPVGPLGSRKERFVVFVRQPHCRLRRRLCWLCRLYVSTWGCTVRHSLAKPVGSLIRSLARSPACASGRQRH